MENPTRSVLALALLSGSALFAQNIVGTWQGTLKPPNANGPGLRTVFKITRADDESLKGQFFSIDQNPTPLNATTITLKGTALKVSFAALNGTYEGTLSGDGNSITGNWSQGGPSLPLNLTKATPETAWTIPEPPPPPVPMAASADPAYAVATIKPSEPGRPGKLFTRRGQDQLALNMTLSDLIIFSYDLHPKQVTGLPSWADSDKYDITGRPDKPGNPSNAQSKIMMQKLLADRFQLKFHREKKELPAYTITVLKSGSKLKESAPESQFHMLFGGSPTGGVNFNVGQTTMARSRRRVARRRFGQAGGGPDRTYREVRLHSEVHAGRDPVDGIGSEASNAGWGRGRPRRATGYLHRIPAAARAEAGIDQGAGGCAGDR